MHLILDTSVMIELERENSKVKLRVEQLKKEYFSSPSIAFITYFELLEGMRNKSDKNKQRAMEFINLFNVIQTTKLTAQNLVILRNKYEFPISDLLIAAQVMEANGILVTKDKDFGNIKEIYKVIID